MSTDSQLQEYQKEWRDGITTKLDNLTDKIDKMPLMFANQAEFDVLKGQVEKLNEFKNKSLGIIVAVQTALALVGFLIIHFK